MEVEGSTVASVRDASFLKKDALVDDKFNNAAVETTTASDAAKNVEPIKTSEADCSSTVDSSSLGKISDEKDDLLEQIEEVCNDKVGTDLRNSNEISKTSEHEFLKEIEEMEKVESQVTVAVAVAAAAEEKPNDVACEVKAKNVVESEASAIDAVIVGDKVLVVKEDEEPSDACDQSPLATSSEDVKESVALPATKDEEKVKAAASQPTTPNKDATVSSSTTKLEEDLTIADQTLDEKDSSEAAMEEVESTVKPSVMDEEEAVVECKSAEMEETVEEKMEVDNEAAEVKNEAMEVDIKEPSSQNSAETLSMDTGNEALKAEEVPEKNEAQELTDVDMKETAVEKEQQSDQKPSPGLKSVPSVIDEVANDKPEPTVSVVNHNDDEKSDETPIVETTKPENKHLLDLKLKENIVSSSLTNTPVSSSNVFNSTPIQKQFEISSENVSKISDVAELSRTEKEEDAVSTKPLNKSFEDSATESGTCATSETDHPSSDGTMKKYIHAIKKYNGMPDTTTDEEDTTTPAKTQKINENFEIKISNLSGTDLKKDSAYEVNVCCDQNDVRYLSIERVDLSSNKNKIHADKASTSESSVQSSSNGSVTSLPAYALPQTVETPTSASTSSSTNCHSLTTTQNKHTILGIEELCNFMINQFTKIKHAVNPESASSATTAVTGGNIDLTPTQQIKKNKKNSPMMETPSTSASKSKRARKRSLQEDDIEGTPKAKQAKRDISKETPKGDETADSEDLKSGPCVLAKWIDKKFYAGKITAEKPGNKYVVLFEDGASKTLPKESIVFGEGDTLPLQDQQVYALVEEDYEIGTVLSIEKSSNKVIYTVKTENTTVKVTASDIYLEVDQAKEIQKLQNIKVGDSVEEEESSGTRPSRNKRPPASPSTPEAGYSGAAGKRGGKRQKRYS